MDQVPLATGFHLLALPRVVNVSVVELLWMLDRPQLLADDQVVRLQRERPLQQLDRLLALTSTDGRPGLTEERIRVMPGVTRP
jgi:hypothetical protein